MLQFYELVEMGCQSRRTYEYLDHILQKLQDELHTIHDECDKDPKDVDVGRVEDLIQNSQVQSNLTFTLQDPLHVPSKGRPKSLRQKHPKEKQVAKKRTSSICKKMGHLRSTCPLHKHARYSYNYLFRTIYIKIF